MKKKAIIALVFGICGIVLSAVPFIDVIAIILSIIGIILAATVLKSGESAIKELSLAALICSIAGVVIGIPMIYISCVTIPRVISCLDWLSSLA